MIIDMDELERLARGATGSPWRAGSVETSKVFVQAPDGIGPERVLLRMNEHFPNHEIDAEYIAAANPQVVLFLIEQMRMLELRRDELRRAIARVSQENPCPDELRGWHEQRAKMMAEIGTLKARVLALEER